MLRLAGGSGKHGRQGRGGFLKFWNSTEQFVHFKEQTEHEDWFEKPLVHYGSLLPQKVCRIMSDQSFLCEQAMRAVQKDQTRPNRGLTG